jgi:cardiolipin synthase
VRAIAAALLVAVLGACAQLPSAELLSEWRSLHDMRVEGASGPLSAKRSAEILDNLRRTVGDIDILQKHVALEEAVAGSPLTMGNRLGLLQDGSATYDAMTAAIRQARQHINFETYIIEDDEVGRRFADLLIEKRAQGVEINFLYDSVGSLKTPRSFFERMKEAGIRVVEFNPVNPLQARAGWKVNHRDHRKLLVVDGRVAFLGGINISDVYFSGSSFQRSGAGGPGNSPWRDTHVQLEGPVVGELQKMFLRTWAQQRGEPLDEEAYFPELPARGKELVRAMAGGPQEGTNSIYLTLLSAITNAEKQIYITNAYFVPDAQLLTALTDAAARGVDVRLILPSHTDFWAVFHAGRAHYSALLRGGVRIFERKDALLHSKTAVIDAVWSCIGSANLDWRSFLHNDEVNAVVLGTEFARQMIDMFHADLAKSVEIDLAQWQRRSMGLRMKEWLAQLWEYWL